MLKDCF